MLTARSIFSKQPADRADALRQTSALPEIGVETAVGWRSASGQGDHRRVDVHRNRGRIYAAGDRPAVGAGQADYARCLKNSVVIARDNETRLNAAAQTIVSNMRSRCGEGGISTRSASLNVAPEPDPLRSTSITAGELLGAVSA